MSSYTITVSSSTSVSPNTLSIATTGTISIAWVLASATAMSWQASGIQVGTNSFSGTGHGSTTFGGGATASAPSLSGGNTGQYQVSFAAMSGKYVFPYTVNVNGSFLLDDGTGNNPPVIQNEGGTGPWPPGKGYDPDKD